MMKQIKAFLIKLEDILNATWTWAAGTRMDLKNNWQPVCGMDSNGKVRYLKSNSNSGLLLHSGYVSSVSGYQTVAADGTFTAPGTAAYGDICEITKLVYLEAGAATPAVAVLNSTPVKITAPVTVTASSTTDILGVGNLVVPAGDAFTFDNGATGDSVHVFYKLYVM